MGYSIFTTVLASAATKDLSDLITVKEELKITSSTDDGWLGKAISQTSAAIAGYCKRLFVPQLVQDLFDLDQDPYPYQTPGGFPALVLSCSPVIALLSVVQSPAPGQANILTEGADFRVDQETGRLLRLNKWTGGVTAWEAYPVTVQYAGGCGTETVEAHSVPSGSPYTTQVSGTFGCDISVTDAAGAMLARVKVAPAAGQYSVASDGTYTFAAADAGKALTIAYASPSVPADVTACVVQMVNARWSARGRDPTLVQRDMPNQGMERWWVGGQPGQDGPFPPDIAATLDAWRQPVIA